MTKEFVLPSGAKLVVTGAPFVQALALNKALMKAAKGLPMAADPLQMDLSVLKDAILGAATSDEVEAILFTCMERALYNGSRVNRGLFDEPGAGEDARKDFYVIAWHVIEVNCGPFFVQTFSWLKALRPAPASSPAST